MKKPTRREMILGFKARMKLQKTWYDRLADFLTKSFGTLNFFIVHAIFFVIWIFINAGKIPGISAFDPFPFNFLTMVVSLEAIFLSIIVLVSENRQNEIADMREELDFEINVRAEQEITKILQMLEKIHGHLGLNTEEDPELMEMEERIDIKKLGDQLRNKNYED